MLLRFGMIAGGQDMPRRRRGSWHDSHDPLVRDLVGRAAADAASAESSAIDDPLDDDVDPLVVDPVTAMLTDHFRVGSINRLRRHPQAS